MACSRKFYKTVYKVEILSEEPTELMDLDEIAQAISDGPYSGNCYKDSTDEVDGPSMAKLLEDQGSSPEFFQLDSEGNDLDEDEDEDGQ